MDKERCPDRERTDQRFGFWLLAMQKLALDMRKMDEKTDVQPKYLTSKSSGCRFRFPLNVDVGTTGR